MHPKLSLTYFPPFSSFPLLSGSLQDHPSRRHLIPPPTKQVVSNNGDITSKENPNTKTLATLITCISYITNPLHWTEKNTSSSPFFFQYTKTLQCLPSTTKEIKAHKLNKK